MTRRIVEVPEHPGLVLGRWITRSGQSIAEAAEELGYTRAMLSRVCHGHARITPEMALRIEEVYEFRAEPLLRRQLEHDLAVLRGDRSRKGGRVA